MSNSRKTHNLLIIGGIILVITSLVYFNHDKQGFEESSLTIEFDEQAILERAYEDVRDSEEFPKFEEEEILKVFNEDNELIKAITLQAGEEIDEDFRKLINRSTLLAEYSASKIYRLNK